MNVPVSSLMTSPVWSVGMDDTVQAIETLMSRHGLSWVPVVEPGSVPVGVVALSDLMQFRIRNGNPAAATAWQICRYKPLSVSADTSVAEVARLMIEHKIHHVVVTQNHRMVGVVSTLDLVRRCVLDVE